MAAASVLFLKLKTTSVYTTLRKQKKQKSRFRKQKKGEKAKTETLRTPPSGDRFSPLRNTLSNDPLGFPLHSLTRFFSLSLKPLTLNSNFCFQFLYIFATI